MVDAGDLPLNGIVVFHAELGEKAACADLNAVAEADGLNIGHAKHGAGQHGHGVGVVQKPRVRADLFHIAGKILHHTDGAQTAENATDAKRVADIKAVLEKDAKISVQL